MPEQRVHQMKSSSTTSKKKSSKNVKVPQHAELLGGSYNAAVSSGMNGMASENTKMSTPTGSFNPSLPTDALHTHIGPFQDIASLYEPSLQHNMDGLNSPHLATPFTQHLHAHGRHSPLPLPPLPSAFSDRLSNPNISFEGPNLKRTFDQYISGYSPPTVSATLGPSENLLNKIEKLNPILSDSSQRDNTDATDCNEGAEKGGNGRMLVKTKRAEQNRQAQQAFRKRKEERAKELEDKEKVLDQYIAKEEELAAREQRLLLREQQWALKQGGKMTDVNSTSQPAAKPPDPNVEALQNTIADLAEQLMKSNTALEELIKTKHRLENQDTRLRNLLFAHGISAD